LLTTRVPCNPAPLHTADADATPAPGDYHPLPDLPRGPAWTLAAKTALPGGTTGVGSSSSACEQPGPGYYHKDAIEAPAALGSTTGSSASRRDAASAATSTAACGQNVATPATSKQQAQPSGAKGILGASAGQGQAPGDQAGLGLGQDTAAPQAVSCSKQLTLSQLNAQLAGLLKQKGSKQSRMRRYCLAA
jgi:hypothetical protein